MRFLRRLRYWIRHRREARELAEEIESHRVLAEDAGRAEGLSALDARAAARRAMGNATLAAEDSRRVWLNAFIENVVQDLRYAVRSLRAQPAFTTMALLPLVLAIGLNTSLFTSINAALFRTWAVPDASSLVKVFLDGGGSSVLFHEHLATSARTLAGSIFYRPYPVVLAGADGSFSQEAVANAVSANYFEVLRVEMAVGRGFRAQEGLHGSPIAVAVLSYGTWLQRYGGNQNILGGTIRIDDVPFTVVGIAPRTFSGTTGGRTDVWIPPASFRLARPNEAGVAEMVTRADWCCVQLAARLAIGTNPNQASAEIEGIYTQFLSDQGFPLRTPAGRRLGRAIVSSTAHIDPARRNRAVSIFTVLIAAIGSVLLLACANVGNLILARATARQREIAIRLAIGAGRRRIVQQMLTESLLLASVASALGLAIAFGLPRATMQFLNGEAALGNLHWTPDWTVLKYSLGIAIISAIGFGLAPALWCTRTATADTMKRQGTQFSTRSRMRSVLLGIQVAVSVALLVCGSLLVRSLLESQRLNPGLRTEGVTAVRVNLPVNSYDAVRTRAFFDEISARMPSTQPIATTLDMPLSAGRGVAFLPLDRPLQALPTTGHWVNSDFFGLLQIPILAGRVFSASDQPGTAVVINAALANRYWPGENAVGRSVRIDDAVRRVVGVVADSHVSGAGPVPPTVFVPARDDPDRRAPLLLLSEAATAGSIALIRQMEPRASVSVIRLADQLRASFGNLRSSAQLVTALGILALLLATTGVYGVASYTVEQSRQEIGIRMALGARPRAAVGAILGRHARGFGFGLLAGVVLATLGSSAIESQLYGIGRFDPLAYGGVLLLLLSVGAVASVIPAQRAARAEAVTTLRHQ